MNTPQDQVDPFVADVGRFITANGLIGAGERVVVAVSGGADSVALLSALRDLAGRADRQWRLSVAHLNHGLRAEADDDEQFVRQLAERWSLPCAAARRDIAGEAANLGRGIEATARLVRYDFLTATARQCGAVAVAVGHHADDNVETVLHRIVRGTHLRGLAGMRPSRMLSDSPVRLVRPMLSCRRRDVEAYCRRAGLEWRTDHTNADVRYRRNFIRHELLPLMRDKLNPRVDEAIQRLAVAAGQADACLLDLAGRAMAAAIRPAPAGAVAMDAAELAAQPELIRRYVVRLAMEKLSAAMGDMSAARFDDILAVLGDSPPAAVSLPGGLVARRQGRLLILGQAGPSDRPPTPDWVVPIVCPGTTDLPGGRTITCRCEPFDPDAFDRHCRLHPAGMELIDSARLVGKLACRPRADGDVFRPLGCGGSQSVSDFLTNRKIPARLRAEVLCICDEAGIVYLAPLRIDQRVSVTPETKSMLRIEAPGLPGQ